jgi:3-phytase
MTAVWQPAAASQPVSDDPDDPAIWVHPQDATRSLVIGTNKAPAPNGGLYVFDLYGRCVQKVLGIDRPNNVDVEYGFWIGGRRADIVVAAERKRHRLRVFVVDPKRQRLIDVGGRTEVFARDGGEQREPMGVALFRRSRDGAVFAIVSRKSGPAEGYLVQYRLIARRDGMVDSREVRRFGKFSGEGEIEAVAVDDAEGVVYCADEEFGIRAYAADPDAPDANRELCVFGRSEFQGDREGIAIWNAGDDKGYVVCADQLPGRSVLRVYERVRKGEAGAQPRYVGEVSIAADSTDGIEACERPLGRRFPGGLIVAMNSSGKNFMLFDAREWTGRLNVR